MSLDSYHHTAKRPAAGAPLVFNFHGTGDDEHQFTNLIERILPESGIVSPRGDVSEHGANRYFRRRAEGVYDMEDLARRTAKMTGFIRAHAQANPGAPVYGLGYSNGANILASVVFEAPDLFDRVVLMHPLIPWTPAPNSGLRSLEVMVTAGRHDPICPLPQTEALVRYLEDQGAAVDLRLHDGGHEVRQQELDAIAVFLGRGAWVLVALYVQDGEGKSALKAGFFGLPSALLSAWAANWAGKRVHRFGRSVVIGGLVLGLVGLGLSIAVVMLREGYGLSVWWLLLSLSFIGVAHGSVISPNQTLTLEYVPIEYAGSSAAIMQTGQRIGTSVGIAMITAAVFAALSTCSWPVAVTLGFGLIGLVVLVALGVAVKDQRGRKEAGPGSTAARVSAEWR